MQTVSNTQRGPLVASKNPDIRCSLKRLPLQRVKKDFGFRKKAQSE